MKFAGLGSHVTCHMHRLVVLYYSLRRFWYFISTKAEGAMDFH
jgi:hypothetical protein